MKRQGDNSNKKMKMKLCLQMFCAFFKMGLFTFGGGLAMLPLIQRAAVQDYGWMNEEEMVDCIAVSQSMPGVIAVNAATYIGNKKAGILGGFIATLGVILPSFIIIIIAVLFLGSLGDNKYVTGAFTGVKAASCGLILYSAYKLGKQILKNKFHWIIAIMSFIMIIMFDVVALWAILLGSLAGIVYSQYTIRKKASK